MPSIALPVSLRGQLLSGSRFNPISLFSAGEQGIWLDPSDLTTMFTDRAGTTPVTTPGQTVGKRLDKSGRGNHAVAPTDAARPTYGIEPWSGRRNLLTRTEEFGDAVWGKNLVTITSNFDIAPDGTATADQFISAGGSFPQIAESQSLVAGQPYTFSAWVKSDGTAQIAQALLLESGVTAFTPTSTWTRVSVSIASSAGGSKAAVIATNSGAAATSSFLIWGAQLELGSTATAYQRVGTAFDVTEAGVPTVHYVQYDGTDDSFSTSSIDFTATDKMSVFAGVKKLRDGMIAEFSASADANNGSFYYYAGNLGAGDLSAALRGSALTKLVGSAATLPVTRVESVTFDIAGTSRATEIFPRINGASVSLSGFGAADAGTGNFGNYPLFIGRRNNASFPFNGRDYGIIIVGKTASASEIYSAESYLAANTSEVSI